MRKSLQACIRLVSELTAAYCAQDTMESLLEIAAKYSLECLFVRCEIALTSKDFRLTTGNSLLDKHSAVRWIKVAQQHQLVVSDVHIV